MRWMRTVLNELYGLFVDDGLYAAAILVWLGTMWLAARTPVMPAVWADPALFVGLAAILLESVLRRARR